MSNLGTESGIPYSSEELASGPDNTLVKYLIGLHRQMLQEASERREDNDKHLAHNVLSDKAWKGLNDFLTRAKMENIDRHVTVGQLVGLNEKSTSLPMKDDDVDDMRVWITAVKKQSELLDSIQVFLDEFSKSADLLQQSLKNVMAIVSPKIGYADLPNELLIRIFYHVDDITARHTRQRISLVCRQFRDLYQSVPEFWSDIDFRMPVDIVDLHLSQSKNVGLSVSMWICEPDTANFESACRILRECHRWKRFRFHSAIDVLGEDPLILRQPTMVLRNLNLPLLQDASIFCCPGSNFMGVKNLGLDFYTTWDAPSLETATFVNMFPMTNETFKLKTITIDYPEHERGYLVGWTHLDLGEYLLEQPFVETLRLGIKCDGEFEQDDLTECFSVPTLRSLHIRDIQDPTGPSASLKTITSILSSLEAPALETLELCVTDKPLKTGDIKNLFAHGNYSNLTNLSLLVRDYRRFESRKYNPLQPLFKTMHSLQHLKLECPDYGMCASLPFSNLSGLWRRIRREPPPKDMPLRTIHLSNCEGLTARDVNGIVEELEAGWNWRNLETIRVSNCRDVEPEWLRSYDVAKTFVHGESYCWSKSSDSSVEV